MGMVKRHIQKVRTGYAPIDKGSNPNFKTIGANFYPVDSAIVMRDHSGQSNIQVTIMNERAQGGTADLTSWATIELM